MTSIDSSPRSGLRIGMLLFGDVAHDARILREARTLAEAGHDVRLAVAGGPRADMPEPDAGPLPFEIVIVARPAGPPVWLQWIWRPWRLRGRVAAVVESASRRGPAGWLQIAAIGGLVVASLAWVVVRGAIQVIARRLGRPGSGIDWLLWWRYVVGGWGANAGRAIGPVDVWHGHDLTGLVAAASAARTVDDARGRPSGQTRSQLVYDSHEIYLESRTNVARPGWARHLVEWWERRLARRAFGVVTVNEALSRAFDRRWQPHRIVVVHNCPPRWFRPASLADLLRLAADIPATAPIVLYHGGFLPYRGLAETALAMLEPGLEQAHLVFLGFGRERPGLDRLASEVRFSGRIHVLDAVPPDQVLDWVAGAAVDVMAIAPSTLNHVLSTPNKLFESLAAGVPAIVSDLPEMRRIVCDDPTGPLGATCDPTDPASIATAIRSVLDLPFEAQSDLRRRCLEAAHSRWNWETEGARLVAFYQELTDVIRPSGQARGGARNDAR